MKIHPNKPNYFLCRYTPVLNQTAGKELSTLGSLNKYTIGLSCNHQNDITWGITARKQGGESFYWDHATYRYGFNLWSLFLRVDKKKYIKRIIVGDYQIGYGQGLFLSAGYIHRGDLIRSIIRSNNLGIRPYKGIKRIGWRGIALTSDIGTIEVTGFYANNHLDATLQLDQARNPYIKRIDTTGKYDTVHHLAQKGTVNEQLFGCTLRKGYHRNQTEVGINLMYNHYDIPLLIRKQDAIDGYWLRAQSAASLFYRLLWNNCLFFGEGGLTLPQTAEINPRLAAKRTYGSRICRRRGVHLAAREDLSTGSTSKLPAECAFFRKSPAYGLIIGSIISLSRYIDLSMGLYHYDQALYTPYGAPFKRYLTDHGNEKGSYVGLTCTPLSNWHLSTSRHFFATLSPKPLLAVASNGQRFVIRSSYTWHRSTIWTIQYKLDKNPRNRLKQADKIVKVAEASQNSVKSKVDHQLTHYWWSCFELQYTSYAFLGEIHHGYALSSRQKWKANKWQFACQAIYFNTENHATRLYFYLPSPLYSGITFRSYYAQGVVTSGLICWKPMAFIRLEMIYTCIYSDDCHSKNELTQTNKPPSRVKHHGSIQLLF